MLEIGLVLEDCRFKFLKAFKLFECNKNKK